MAIFKTIPYYSFPVWSGRELNEKWNKQATDNIGESWELSVIENCASYADCENYKNVPMDRLLCDHPEWTKNGVGLLFKFIDTDSNLSVQVHPDDKYALEKENSLGKTESWYILDNKPGAVIYLGLKENVTKAQLKESLQNGTVLNLLNRIEVKKGDYFFIPSGTIHALGAGVTVAEIQQSSKITYRLYDYGRLQNGKPRQLHISEALDVCSLSKTEPASLTPKLDDGIISVIKKCDYFTSSLLKINKNSAPVSYFYDDYSIISVLEGKCYICTDEQKIDTKKGDTLFISKDTPVTITTSDDALLYINSAS